MLNQSLEFSIDHQNEQTVLGQALNHEDHRELFLVRCEWTHFRDQRNRVVAWCIMTMVSRGLAIEDDSFTLVATEFPEPNKAYGGNTYLAQLRRLCPNETRNYEQHLTKLETDYVKAQVATSAIMRAMTACANPHSSLDEIEAQLEHARRAITDHRPVDIDFDYGVKLYDRYILALRRRADDSAGTFVQSGFEQLDEVLVEGFAKQKISIVAAMTGMAKSAFTTNVMLLQAGEGYRVGKCSLEMPLESEVDRMVSAITCIPLTDIIKNTGSISPAEKERIVTVARGIRDSETIFINDQAIQTLSSVDSQLALLERAGKPLDVLFIDLFGKLADVSSSDNLAATVEHKLKLAREIARRRNVHICCVVQLKRYFEMNSIRPNKPIPRPKLDKIKNSYAFAEEADLVLLLHRNKYYKPELIDDILEVEVAKQRQGGMSQKVYFEFDGPCCRIMRTSLLPDDHQVLDAGGF